MPGDPATEARSIAADPPTITRVKAEPPAPGRALVGYELTLQALRDPFLAPLAATVRRRTGAGMFGEVRSDDLQRIARQEALSILETAFLLTGERTGPAAVLHTTVA